MQIKQRLVDYYRTSAGKEPAKEWLESIKDNIKKAHAYWIE
jgi:hypothetical protein